MLSARIMTFITVSGLLIAILPSFVDAKNSFAPISTIDADKSWSYTGYQIDRYSTENEDGYYFQLEGTDKIREQGVLVISDLEDRLMILRAGESEIEVTPFTLPNLRTCYGCFTSLRQSSYPMAYLVDDRIVVTMDGKWYLLDAVTMESELWFDPEVLNMTGIYTMVTFNDQVYVHPTTGGYDIVDDLYWVYQPNTLEQIYEVPEGMNIHESRLNVGHNEAPQDVTPAYFMATDDVANGALIGQVGNGVYVMNDDQLTKIGYAGSTLYGYVWTMNYTPYAPLAFGESVAWVGSDRSLYVAKIDYSKLISTGLRDLPAKTPYKMVSNSAVFYDAVNPDPINVYMSATAYIHANQDSTFAKVITIADDIYSVESLIETSMKVY